MATGRPRPATPPAAAWTIDPRLVLLLVLAAALAVRIANLLFDRGDPFFEPVLLDAKYYHQWAQRILDGDLVSRGVFYGLPLYPYFLALCSALTGGSTVAVKLVQLLLGLVTVFFTYRIGERVADQATGLLAAGLAALFRTALRLDPKNCQAATNLGVALEQSGKVDEARQEWTRALEVDPTCESARRALSKPR
jgi:hypothetical protein